MLNKLPINKNAKSPVGPHIAGYSISNPFDSDDESDINTKLKPHRRNSSEPKIDSSNVIANTYGDTAGKHRPSSSYSHSSTSRNTYKKDFRDSGGLENQTVQELENYAVYKAEDTTKTVNNCLKITEEMREDATKTLVNLHQQGEQITRTHMVAADISHDLSRSEKLLGNLGGMFSRTWRPKKTPPVTGPVITRDDPAYRKGNHLEQRERLGLGPTSKGRPTARTPYPEPTDALQKVEVEKAKQDDGLSEISNALGELKEMALDIGSELEKQVPALDEVLGDVDAQNIRIVQINRRAQYLLRK